MPGNISREADMRSVINIKVEGIEAVSEAERRIRSLGDALNSVVKGADLGKYFHTQESSIDGVSIAFEKYQRILRRGMTGDFAKGYAESLVKSYNSFLALGGDANEVILTLGENFKSVFGEAQKMMSGTDLFSNVGVLKDMYSSLEYASKNLGLDIVPILEKLSAADTSALEESLRSAKIEAAGLRGQIEELEAQLRDAEAGSGIDTLKADLESAQMELARIIAAMRDEFKSFLISNNFSGDDLEVFGQFSDYFERIGTTIEEDGRNVGVTVRRVIGDFKRDFGYLLREMNEAAPGSSVGIDEVGEKIRRTGEAIKEAGDAVASSGGVEKIQGVADAIKDIANSGGVAGTGTTEESAASYISQITNALARLSDADPEKLKTIYNALSRLSGLNNFKVNSGALNSVVETLDALGRVKNPENISLIGRLDFTKLSGLQIKKPSLRNLAEFLPAISNVNPAGVSALKEIAAIDWTNLGNMKVSKASVANLASLVEIMDTVKEIQARVEAVENATGVMPVIGGATNASELEAEAAALEHATVAVEEYTVAEEHAANAVMDATPNIGAIEEESVAREHVTEAATAQTNAEIQVAEAEAASAQSSSIIEQVGAAHEQAAHAADVQAEAERNAARAIDELAGNLEAITGGGGSGSGGPNVPPNNNIDLQIDQLRELIGLQKQLGTFIAKGDGGAANIERASTLYSDVTAHINQASSALSTLVNKFVESGEISKESLAAIKTLFAEINSSATVGGLVEKRESTYQGQVNAAYRQYYAEEEAAAQRAAAAADKWYQQQSAASERAASAAERSSQRQIDAWKKVDDARIAADEKQLAHEQDFAYKEQQAELEAQRQKQRDVEAYYASRDAAAAEAAAKEQEQIRREVEIMEAAVAGKESQENAAWREYYAAVEAEADKAAAAANRYYQQQETAASQAASVAEQETQRQIDAWNRLEDAKEAADVRIAQRNAQQAVAAIPENYIDATKLEALRTQVNALRDDITRAMADSSNLGADVIGDLTSRAQGIIDVANAYREEANAARDAAKATEDIRRASDLRNKVEAYIEKNPRVYEAYRDQFEGFREAVNNTAGVTKEKAEEISSAMRNIDAAARSAGTTGQTFFQKLQAGWQKFAGWTLVTRSFTMVISTFKKMVNAVKEVDAAMTELRKVTDLTAVGYESLYQRAVNVATSIGASVSDTINATAD